MIPLSNRNPRSRHLLKNCGLHATIQGQTSSSLVAETFSSSSKFVTRFLTRQDFTSSRPRKLSGVDHDHCLPHQPHGHCPQSNPNNPLLRCCLLKLLADTQGHSCKHRRPTCWVSKRRQKTTDCENDGQKYVQTSTCSQLNVVCTFTPSCRSLGCSLIRHSSKIDTPCHAK